MTIIAQTIAVTLLLLSAFTVVATVLHIQRTRNQRQARRLQRERFKYRRNRTRINPERFNLRPNVLTPEQQRRATQSK